MAALAPQPSAGSPIWQRTWTRTAISPEALYLQGRLPQTFGRKEDVMVAMARIEAVQVRTLTHHSSKGGTSYTYAPELMWRDEDGQLQQDKLTEWHDGSRAEAFAEWLRRRLAGSADLD